MKNFAFKKAKDAEDAIDYHEGKSRYIAGGTTLIDLMKLEVENPEMVIDLSRLPFQKIDREKDGSFTVGAFVRNTDLAHHELIEKEFPLLSQAILAGASTQIRNKATTSGNLLQRTRCVYFRDPSKPCNKRAPGSGCSAIEGYNRNLAILGTSESCIASNPSDMNVAMMALEARVKVLNKKGKEKTVAISEFYRLPGTTPDKETVLDPGDLITAVQIPALPPSTRSMYLKLRDRASYEFALSSAAVALTMSGSTIQRARFAMGGVGAIPWRSIEAEKVLEGSAASEARFQQAADLLLKGARPQSQNAFKVELAKRCLVSALKQVAGMGV